MHKRRILVIDDSEAIHGDFRQLLCPQPPDGMEELDVVRESIEIVRSYTVHGAAMKWDYRLEDPHQDARGFRAAEPRPS